MAACNPVGVMLLGFVARGEDSPDSDLDLLVVPSFSRSTPMFPVARPLPRPAGGGESPKSTPRGPFISGTCNQG